MTDDAFRELVNLHLDGELSSSEEARLGALIAGDTRRLNIFREVCRLHDATQMALDPQLLQPKDLKISYFWSYLFISTCALTCAILGSLFMIPCMIQDRPVHISVPLSKQAPKIIDVRVALSVLENELQQLDEKRQVASLAAHLHLQGLNPELTRDSQDLSPIDHESIVNQRAISLNDLDLNNGEAAIAQNTTSNVINTQSRISSIKTSILRVKPKHYKLMGFSSTPVSFR
jgi:hypothetical protein